MAHKVRPALALGAAISPAGELWVTGLDAGRLFIQSSPDSGKSWREKAWLATADDKIAAEGDSFPSLAFGPANQVVIAYVKPLAKLYTGEVRLLRSTDAGASFAPPITVHADRQLITHRFQSLIFDAKGLLHVLWIDKRDAEALGPAAKAGYRGAAIYQAVSSDGGASFGGDKKLADCGGRTGRGDVCRPRAGVCDDATSSSISSAWFSMMLLRLNICGEDSTHIVMQV